MVINHTQLMLEISIVTTRGPSPGRSRVESSLVTRPCGFLRDEWWNNKVRGGLSITVSLMLRVAERTSHRTPGFRDNETGRYSERNLHITT